MLLSSFIRESTAALETIYPSPEARGMVLILCEETLGDTGVRSYTHIIEPATEIPADRLPALQECVRRMAGGEPLQYVLGFADFHGRRFRVSPSVLIPRPETEELVDMALGHLRSLGRPSRVLDLCTGSGCIAWSVALDLPDCEVDAVDISEEALSVARNQFPEIPGPAFHRKDILPEKSCEDFRPGYDMILSNPPYIMEAEKKSMRANVLDHEPGLALFVPDTDPLLFYRAVARWAAVLLAPGGTGIVELNETLGAGTEAVFREYGFRETALKRDFCNKFRFLEFKK